MPFPPYIDNTIRKAFATCPTKMYNAHVENLRPATAQAVDLVFGGAFARGVEVARKAHFERGEDAMHAIDEAGLAAVEHYRAAGPMTLRANCYKTVDRLMGALRYYFDVWPLGVDGLTPVPGGIESEFKMELPFHHPDDRELPLFYVGRRDMVARDGNGRLYVVDEKTASRLGDMWDMKWDMDSQMTGYIAATWDEQHDEQPEIQALVRGISISKNDYGHAEINIVRTSWFIDQWRNQLWRDVRRMIDAYRSGQWDMALHENACVQYGRHCDYAPLCQSPNAHMMRQDATLYRREVWNPLERK